LLTIFQADEIGYQIITVAIDVRRKLEFVGKNFDEYSLDTMKIFYADPKAAEFRI
jgi:transaldolase